MINFSENHWNEITYCAREDVYGHMLPAEWFILNGPFATKEEAEDHQARLREELKGTDAEWPEANAAAKIVHDDELAQYGLKPLNPPDVSELRADIAAEKAAYDAETRR